MSTRDWNTSPPTNWEEFGLLFNQLISECCDIQIEVDNRGSDDLAFQVIISGPESSGHDEDVELFTAFAGAYKEYSK